MAYKEIVILDPRPYTDPSRINELRVNLADVTIEAGSGPIRERVNTHTLTLKQNPEGTPLVTNDELDRTKDVLLFYSEDTHLWEKEKRAARKMREHLITQPVGTVSVWFSPFHTETVPDKDETPYKEGRIVAGHVTQKDGAKVMNCYAIPTDLPPQEMLLSAWRLAEFNETEHFELKTPEDLRTTPVNLKLPKGEGPWEFLSQFINIPEAWEVITSGEVEKKKQEKLIAAGKIAPGVLREILNAKTPREKVAAMEFATNQMARQGFKIDKNRLDCAIEIGGNTKPLWSKFSFGIVSPGNRSITFAKEGSRILCCKCPFCKKEVSAEIYGDKIHCPEPPSGCGKSAPWKD